MAATEISADVTVTRHVLGLAPARDGRPALVDAADDRIITYADLAGTVRAAAAGLVWHGMRPGDVAGVYVAGAVPYVLAGHAIRAAGGVPSPLRLDASLTEIAEQLTDCGARVLITTAALADTGLAATERSWVRQVISFGEFAGTIPFTSLLTEGPMRPVLGIGHDLALLAYLRAADGSARAAPLSHDDMVADLRLLAARSNIAARDVVVAAPPFGDGRSYTTLLDLALIQGATVVAAPSAAGRDLLDSAHRYEGTVAIVPPGTDLGRDSSLRLLAG